MTRSEEVAAEIRAALARRKMSSRQLARLMDLPTATVGRWTSGVTPMTLDQAGAVAEALGLDLLDLIPRRLAATGTTGAATFAPRAVTERVVVNAQTCVIDGEQPMATVVTLADYRVSAA
jgi:transcriptional regulator with XRE-family HTH domain